MTEGRPFTARDGRSRWGAAIERILIRASVGVSIVVGLYIAVEFWGGLDNHLHGSLADWYGYMNATHYFLRTGQFYWPFQVTGHHYDVIKAGGQLYPPVILYLLVPFTVLPAFLWWAIPIGITAGTIVILRPARWTWPLLMLAFVAPRTGSIIWFGNPGMWIVAAMSLGALFRWPSALVLLKPSLAPFALLGIRHRGWWALVGLGLLASLPLLHLWEQYPSVVLNSGVDPLYSLSEAAPMCLPLIALAGRRGRSFGELRRQAAADARRLLAAAHMAVSVADGPARKDVA